MNKKKNKKDQQLLEEDHNMSDLENINKMVKICNAPVLDISLNAIFSQKIENMLKELHSSVRKLTTNAATLSSSHNADDMSSLMMIASDLAVEFTGVLYTQNGVLSQSQWKSYLLFINCCSSLATVRTFYNVDLPVLRRVIADYERIMVTLDSNLETLNDISQIDTAKTNTELDKLLQSTTVTFDQIIGNEDIKRNLKTQIDNRLFLDSYLFFLFYGPPGTGKSTLSKAVANYVKGKFFLLNISDLQTPYVGETDILIANLFKRVYEDQDTTYVLVFDEIDSVLRDPNKGSVPAHLQGTAMTLQNQISGTYPQSYNLIIIGITNYKEDLRDAVLRRVTYGLFIDLPTMDEKLLYMQYICAINEQSEHDIQYYHQVLHKLFADQIISEYASNANLENLYKNATTIEFNKMNYFIVRIQDDGPPSSNVHIVHEQRQPSTDIMEINNVEQFQEWPQNMLASVNIEVLRTLKKNGSRITFRPSLQSFVEANSSVQYLTAGSYREFLVRNGMQA